MLINSKFQKLLKYFHSCSNQKKSQILCVFLEQFFKTILHHEEYYFINHEKALNKSKNKILIINFIKTQSQKSSAI